MNRFESIATKPLMWLMALLLAAAVAGCGDGNGAATGTDSTAPTVTTSCECGHRYSAQPNITATFSEAMDPATITLTTFTLTKQGSATAV